MSSIFEKALSLDWNGQSFVLTLRNEVTNAYNYALSTDGINWSTSTLPGSNPSNVKWTGSKFIMDGISGNNLLTSKTGQNFSSIPIQGNAATFGIYDLECNLEQTNQITFPQNMTLALGGISADSTKIAYSTDSGITWSSATSAAGVFSGSCNAAVWNGKIWVAVGSFVGGGAGNTIATSPDGIKWTGRGAYIFSTAGNAVAWAKELGIWVATGQGTNIAAYSYDGVYWFAGTNTSSLLSGQDVKWNGTTWVLAGSSNTVGILYSSDGKNWVQVQGQNVAISSNNYAQSWNIVSGTTNNWLVIRGDSTGLYQAAIDISGIIYNTSTIWSTAPTTYSTGILLGSNPGLNGAAIAVSGNGAVQYALLNGATNPLWVSTNYGATWTNTTIAAFAGTKVGWTGIATDTTGSYVLVTSNLSSGVGGIWLTTTGAGGAWSKIAGYTGMNSCSMSSTGQWQTAVDIYGAVYTSSAYGAAGSWTTASAPNAFNRGLYQTPATKIAMSPTGQYITASYASSSTVTTDAYNMMLSSATNGVMDNSANIYMGGNQSAGSQNIYKISVSSGGGGGSTVVQIANLSALGATVFVNQSMPMALDQTNGLIYFNQASTNIIYKVVISTGIATLMTSLNTSLAGLSTVSPSAMVCDSTGNLYVTIASVAGTTAYLCKYTTGGVFSSVSKTVSTGTLSLGIDRSNNLYLSYPNQVDQYSSATLGLMYSGIYNSGRFVKYMTFDVGGNSYYYDAGSIIVNKSVNLWLNTQVILPSNSISCVLQDLSQNVLLLYSNTINRYNSQNVFMNTVTGVTGSIYKMAFDSGYNLYTITPSGTCNIYKYTYNGNTLVNVNGSSPYITNAVMTNVQGFNIDTNNNIYVTNTGNIIYKYLSGNTIGYTTYISTNANISGAQGTTIDSNNNLYWINAIGNTIAKQSYTTSNNNSATIIISNLPAAPYGGITIDNLGYIYIGTTSVTNNYVMKYSSAGVLLSQYFISNLGSNATQSLYFLNNSFYVGLNSSTVVSSYTINAQITGLNVPQYSCVDSFGAVYTTNYSTGTVSKYGYTTSTFGYAGGLNNYMCGVDTNGYIYVTMNDNSFSAKSGNIVAQYTSNGTLISSNFIYSSSPVFITSIAFDSNNYMYLCNYAGSILQYHINSSGIIDSSNVSFITGLPANLTFCAIDKYGSLYISISSGSIYKYGILNGSITSTNTTFITGIGGTTYMIAFDRLNNIYVSNYSVIKVYPSSGGSTPINASFISIVCTGVVIDSYGYIYLNNSASIYKYTPSGTLMGLYYIAPTGSNYFSIDKNNNIYIGNYLANNLISKIAPTFNTNYITGLSNPTGCCLDPNNNLYVCNSGAGTVNAYVYGNPTPITYVSGLTNPSSCVMDNNAILYTSTNSNITINKTLVSSVSSNNTNYTYGTGLGNFCLTFDTSNNLYASFSASPWLAKFTVGASSVTFVSTINTNSCNGVTYSNGYIYGCQYGTSGYISRYNISTSTNNPTFISVSYPMYCSVDNSGNIYVSSYQTSGFISMYSSAGTVLNASLITGNQPYGTCFDSLGYFYVNWTGTSQIVKYLLKGNTAPISMLTISASGSTRGLSIDKFNNLYYGSATMNVYSSVNGKLLRTFSTTMGGDAGNFDNSGNFWYWNNAAGAGNFVKTSFPTTNSTITIPPINTSNQFAVDSSGNLLIPTKNNTVSSSNFARYGVSSYVVANANNVCFDSLNNLYATSNVSPTQYIYKYLYGNTTTRTTFLSISDTDSRGITIDNMDNLYVCRNNINSIQVYNQSASLINTISCASPLFCCFDAAYKYLYVSSGNSILKYDTSGNNLATIGTVNNASQIVLDPYGYFWAIGYSASNATVFKFDSSGATYTTTISGVNCNGIAIDNYGYIYLNYNQNAVYMYTYTGQLLSSSLFSIASANAFGIDKYGAIYSCSLSGGIKSFNPNIILGLVSPSGIAIDSSNNIYVTSGNTVTGISVSTYTSSGTLITPNYIQGSYMTPLGNPRLTMDTANNLYITDSSTNTVNIFNTKLNLSQSFISQFVTVPYLTSNYGLQSSTNFMGMDSNTNLYYGQTYPNNGFNIYKITSGLTASTYYSNAATSNMVSDTSGNLYWTTSGNSIVKYNTITQNQSIYTDINTGGIILSFLNNPTGLAIDVSNNLYVCSGTSIAKVAYSTQTPSILFSGLSASPYSLASDSSANIYALLATSPQHTIYKITPAGSGSLYYTGNTTNGLYYGYGIVVDTSNNVYVASINSAQTTTSVNLISASGSYITLFTVTAANPFISGYSALSIDPYNNLYLSVGNTVTKYNIASQTTGNFTVSTSAPISLAFDANFNTYMMDTSYNVHIDKLKVSTQLIRSSNYGLSGSWVAGNITNISDIAISGFLQSVISSGNVYASTNGGSTFTSTTQINCISVSISQNGGLLSTVMTNGSIYYSGSFGNSTNLIWNGRAWINAISNNSYITSADGIVWNSVTVGVSNAITNMVYSAKSQTTLLSSGSSVYSTYTNNYGNLSVGTLSFPVSALIFNGSYYLAGGNVVATSVDAQTWRAGNAISGMSAIKNFAWNTPDQGTASIKPMTIAMGQGNTNTIGYSYDGIQWYGAGSSVFTARGNKAVWNGQIWCAVGAGVNWVASSYNGVGWTGRNTYMMNEGYDIAWNGVAFVAVGIGATPIVTSPNGINWYPVVNSSTIFTNYVSSIVWTGFVWMAYGSSVSGPVVGICANPNGTTWTIKTVANLSLTPKTRPIVTKTNVLHPLTTTSGTTYLYSTADLYGNSVSGNVNLLYPINGNLTGLKMPIVTASVFDGYNYLVLDVSGNGSLMTNQASNTNLAFTSTYAGGALSTNLSTVNGGAYNGRLVILGGATTGGNVITYNTFDAVSSSQFTAATSANGLFTQVNGLASNSGYGPVYVPNALYLNAGDKLSMVGPKAYSQTIAPTTNITVNLLNTVTNPQNIATIYPSVTPNK